MTLCEVDRFSGVMCMHIICTAVWVRMDVWGVECAWGCLWVDSGSCYIDLYVQKCEYLGSW